MPPPPPPSPLSVLLCFSFGLTHILTHVDASTFCNPRCILPLFFPSGLRHLPEIRFPFPFLFEPWGSLWRGWGGARSAASWSSFPVPNEPQPLQTLTHKWILGAKTRGRLSSGRFSGRKTLHLSFYLIKGAFKLIFLTIKCTSYSVVFSFHLSFVEPPSQCKMETTDLL